MQPRIDQEPLTAQLRRLSRWIVPGLVIAVVAVIVSNYRVSLTPPSLEPDSAEFAAASTQVLVDFPEDSALLETKNPLGPLAERANVYARLAVSPAIVDLIAKEAGIPASAIDVKGPYNPYAERAQREPTAERRATQLRAERQNYRLRFDTEQFELVPLVQVYAQAPTLGAATRLADAGAAGITKYVKGVQQAEGLEAAKALRLRQLGGAKGGVVNPGVDRQIAVLVFLAAFFAWAVLVLVASNLRRFLRARARTIPDPRPASRTVFDLEHESLERPYVGRRR